MKKFLYAGYGVIAVLLSVLSFTACSEDDPEPEPDTTEPVVPVEAVISASKAELVANGTDEIVLTVNYGEEDVTEQSIIMHNGEKMEGNVFTTKEAGVHEFYAVYNYEVTAKITVTATPNPETERYDGFVRRVLAVQGTGTWCGYCPRLSAGIVRFNEKENSDDVVFVASHSGDVLSNSASETVINYLGMNGLPAMKLNLDNALSVNTSGTGESIAGNIRNRTDFILRTPSKVAIRANVSEADENGDITVDAEIKIGVGSTYRVAAWLVEDKVYARQNDPYGYGGADEKFNNHDNVLRASSSTAATGDLLNGKDKIPAKTIESFSCKFNTTAAGVKEAANCHVVIFVCAYNSGTFTVDNVIDVPLGANTKYEYKN